MKRILLVMMTLALPAAAEFADIHGLKLYYEVHGTAGAQPPLVLLHGGGSSIDISFPGVVRELAKGRQVIAFDQQGHGRTTDVPDRPFTFEQSADDAAALMRHLGIARADFFGYSNGGSIALQIAIRHPKLVRRLIVASTPVSRAGLPPGFFDGMRQATLDSMPAVFRENYTRLSPHPERLRSFFEKSVRRMLDFRDVPTEVLQGLGVGRAGNDQRSGRGGIHHRGAEGAEWDGDLFEKKDFLRPPLCPLRLCGEPAPPHIPATMRSASRASAWLIPATIAGLSPDARGTVIRS